MWGVSYAKVSFHGDEGSGGNCPSFPTLIGELGAGTTSGALLDMVVTMRIAVIGQSAFGEAVLRALARNGADDVVGVFCPPDREGRPFDPIKSAAVELNVDVFQPRRMRSKRAIEEFRLLDADLCVMAFVTDFVASEILEAPRLGTIQYHPSLLPKHRGPSSINWPIIFGEPETGLTIFWPDDGLDTGPILLQKRVPIGSDDTLGSLYFGQLFPLGVEAMVESVELVRRGEAPRIKQDETRATYEGWCKDEDAQIDWQIPAGQVYNLVRGSNPRPGAHTTHRGEVLRLFDCELLLSGPDGAPGTVTSVSDGGFEVGASGGRLRVKRVQVPGQRKVAAGEWAASVGLQAGDSLGG